MAFAVSRFQVGRLHERIDVGHLEYAFVLIPPYAVTPLGDRSFVIGDHLALLCRVQPKIPPTGEGECMRHSYACLHGIARNIINW
jgi:hypothetical protein